jgi:hypothetical protein
MAAQACAGIPISAGEQRKEQTYWRAQTWLEYGRHAGLSIHGEAHALHGVQNLEQDMEHIDGQKFKQMIPKSALLRNESQVGQGEWAKIIHFCD